MTLAKACMVEALSKIDSLVLESVYGFYDAELECKLKASKEVILKERTATYNSCSRALPPAPDTNIVKVRQIVRIRLSFQSDSVMTRTLFHFYFEKRK